MAKVTSMVDVHKTATSDALRLGQPAEKWGFFPESVPRGIVRHIRRKRGTLTTQGLDIFREESFLFRPTLSARSIFASEEEVPKPPTFDLNVLLTLLTERFGDRVEFKEPRAQVDDTGRRAWIVEAEVPWIEYDTLQALNQELHGWLNAAGIDQFVRVLLLRRRG